MIMDTKRTTVQKWGFNMQDVITNCLVAECDCHKNREYAYCPMFLSSLGLENRSRKWL